MTWNGRSRSGCRDQRQRLRGIEPAVVERASGDGARELLRTRLQHRLDIIDRGEAAGGDDRARHTLCERDGGVAGPPDRQVAAMNALAGRSSSLAFGVRPPLQIGATLNEIGEGFGIVQKNAVVRHFLVVRLEHFLRLRTRNELHIA
jgi:hypothetical protein